MPNLSMKNRKFKSGIMKVFEQIIEAYRETRDAIDERQGQPKGGTQAVVLLCLILSRQMKMLEGEAARVKYLYEQLVPGLLPGRSRPPPLPSPMADKSSQRSTKLRLLAVEMHERERKQDALSLFAQAVTTAPIGSEAMLEAYNARSKAIKEMKESGSALVDINRALAMLPPDTPDTDSFKKILIDRKKACKPRPLPHQGSYKLFKLPFGTNADVPCASDAVRISYSERLGRSVVATRRIRVGETIALEKPYLVYIRRPYRHSHCYGCGEQCDTMLPCKTCSQVMFCNGRCWTAAAKMHANECPLMNILVEWNFNDFHRVALLTVLRARTDYASWEEFRSAVGEIEAVQDILAKGYATIRDKNGIERRIFDSKYYASTHSMQTNLDKRSCEDLMEKAFAATMLLYLLKYHTAFFADCPEDDISSVNSNFWFTGGLLLRHMMTSQTNMQGLYCTVGNICERYGFGVFPFSSLVNHSCAPNVCEVTYDKELALVALRPINKGQELFTSNGIHHTTHTRRHRDAYLESHFQFQCRCEACANSWPLFGFLEDPPFENRAHKKMAELVGSSLHENLWDCAEIFARSTLNVLYTNAAALEPYYPCLAIARYQMLIKRCWVRLGYTANTDVPYG